MKELKLPSGDIAFIDDEDFERVNQYVWYRLKHKRSRTIYVRTVINCKWIFLHRFILNKYDLLQEVDHEDRNGLNNVKSNLRICSHANNIRNRTGYGVSKYKGVTKQKGNNWVASIRIDGRTKYLGSFVNEIDAAKAFNKKAIELGNPFFALNDV